ncbi:hypothetical protein RFM68_19875 [Mesorhizobium sp. MSK_1335]|uniref:Uncharacterized protein n=1 Tax=Mesorhizobium montanum TaxID=3072323 RepID=A0ABU4ZN49_9HYPH|nr:hypothetical protein [Mesorhizobium sp. MSK_1335]MDX8526760.1 hypothetical protein [Mesorhizobium sp. MSK_1335]
MGRIVRTAQPASPVLQRRLESTIGGNLKAEAVEENLQTGAGDGKAKKGDDYLERVAKYVPAEIVAFFIFVNSILDNAVKKPVAVAQASDAKDVPDAVRTAIQTVTMAGFSVWDISRVVFVIALAMTPLYLKSMSDSADGTEAPGANIVMSMLAFPFWAYAVDAVAFRPWHDGALASIMLAIFTVISGAVRPEYLSGLFKRKPSKK